MAETKYYAPALDKGLDILEFLSAQSFPQSQLEIATGVNRSQNEIYRMLISLEKRGYIAKDLVSGKYGLTLRLFHLAHHHSPIDTLVRASEMYMETLAQEINQSVHLSILDHNKLLIISQAKSRTPVTLSVEIGSLFPLEKTNSGRIILAYLDEEKKKQILDICEDYKTMTESEKTELHQEILKMKTKKCNIHKSLLTEGVTDFSTPILNMRDEVVAVLAVSTLTSQMRKLVSEDVIEKQLIETAARIKEAIGLN